MINLNIDVKLINASNKLSDVSVASARTCYSSKIVLPEEVKEETILRIGKNIYESGHHTPFQHTYFTFAISNVSRQFVWSFLHNHPYYNSEQTSQRYNLLGKDSFYIPSSLSEKQKEKFNKAISIAWDNYIKITEVLKKEKEQIAFALGKIKQWKEKTILSDLEKKALENARYVLPVCAFTNLYHTISGLVLLRYKRMLNISNCDEEAKIVVGKMIEEVKKVDPNFERICDEFTYEKGALPETNLKMQYNQIDINNFNQKFDQNLKPYKYSKLVSCTANLEETLIEVLKEQFGINIPSEEVLDLLLNPKNNLYLLSTLNVSMHSPLMQALNHVNVTFKKKISHTCDSQNQRHRFSYGSKPAIEMINSKKPDYIIPKFIEESDSLNIYIETMETLWEIKNEIEDDGVSKDISAYLLPNSVSIRFTETSSLLNLFHKYKLRTCFNAQHEIYEMCMEEIDQLGNINKKLRNYFGPPCVIRNGLVENDPLIGPCTEGNRWCGIKVWLNWPKVKRPF
ncbi:MAG: FAD-dependent thymidylate synthase [Candidatus Micrarchaeota archaeon]|nr:FAD-dependent thymidylate synthase [Candidatus Micrarchaeota archaeon]